MRARYVWVVVVGAAACFAAASWVTGSDLSKMAEKAAESAKGLFASAPQSAKGSNVAAPGAPPAAVTVSQPVQREIAEWDEYTGRFEAVEAVDIRARVSGYLDEVHFKDGQDVKKGDLLFVIDPRPFELALALAQAEFDQANVRIQNATLDVDRGRPLLDRKVISEKVFDDRSNILREAQAAAKVAEARVASAKLDFEFTRVLAPISGRIGRTIVTMGNFVSAGGSSEGTTLARIVGQDPIYVYFDVSENNAIKYKRLVEKGSISAGTALGTAIELALPDETGFPHKGRLDFLDNRLDAGTGTLGARGVMDNPQGLFSAGMFARVRLQGSERYTATLLPDEAIGTDQATKFVYVVGDDALPVRKTVKLGPLSEGLRVVRSGIGSDDWVVVKGLARVRPGQKLAPKRETIKVSDNATPGTSDALVKR